jgi:hypothetical protein
MYEPSWTPLHFDKGEKEQGKRHILGEVRMDANFALQTNISACTNCCFCLPPRSYDLRR